MTKRRSELKDENGTPLYPTAAEFVRRQLSRAQNDPAYFDKFLFEYMRSYGLSTVDGQDVVRTVSTDSAFTNKKGAFKRNPDGTYTARKNPSSYPIFVKVRQPQPKGKKANRKADRFLLLQQKAYSTWAPVQQKSINGKLFEVNLRDEDGRVSGVSSIIPGETARNLARQGDTMMQGYAVEGLVARTEKTMDENAAMMKRMSIKKECE